MTDTVITLDRSVVEQALEAFSVATTPLARDRQEVLRAIEELRAALEQPQVEQDSQASAAYDMIDRYLRNSLHDDDYSEYSAALDSLYTHPQNLSCKSTQARLATLWGYVKEQSKRKPLTQEAIYDLWSARFKDWIGGEQFESVVRATEAKHNIKEAT